VRTVATIFKINNLIKMHGVANNVKNVHNTPDFPHHHLPVFIMTHLFILKIDKGPSHVAVNNIH